MTRKIAQILEKEGERIRTASDGRNYIVVAFDMEIEGDVILPNEARALFGEEKTLEKVKVGMKVAV